MKKTSLIFVVVIGLLMNVNAFAQSISVDNTEYWVPFTTKNGNTASYWRIHRPHGEPPIPYLEYRKETPGYLYFFIKTDLSQELRDETQKELSKEYPRKFEGVRLGPLMAVMRINCKDNTIQSVRENYYTDTNIWIAGGDVNNTPTPIKGTIFEKIPFDEDRLKLATQHAERRDKEDALLRKYRVERVVGINLLEVNPYEFEGHTIAVNVQFKEMLSPTSAIFFSGYSDWSKVTGGVPDQIIVTGIPKGTHFKGGLYAPKMMLALRGKGTIEGTNAFGARIKAPHFQWIGIISGEQKSVFEEQRDNSRRDALRNVEQSQKIKNR